VTGARQLGALAVVVLALGLGAAALAAAGTEAGPAVRPPAAAADAAGSSGAARLTMEQAVALALQRNRDVIAARLEIEAAKIDIVAARLRPNPTVEYSVGNLVLGHGNPQPPARVDPGFLDQPVQNVGLSAIIDVWSKRTARVRAASQGVELRRLLVEDALREIVYGVRSAFATAGRAAAERELAREVAARYAETVRISQARFRAGDMSEAELRKIELEGLKYGNQVIDAELQAELERGHLVAILGFAPDAPLPEVDPRDGLARPSVDLPALTREALAHRPDLRATVVAGALASAQLSAAEREAYPDVAVGVNYTHDSFTISGDNPNTLGLSVSVPLPIFDRNQAGRRHAELDLRRAQNDSERLRIRVEHDVAEAVRRTVRAEKLLLAFEGPAVRAAAGGSAATAATAATSATGATAATAGGMLGRADTALRVAERSYQSGATSLLELLEAQRTYLETRAQYLTAVHDFRQAKVDLIHAIGD
jgi:cobalt-zinc-cadmium efflux system outer membrane protein